MLLLLRGGVNIQGGLSPATIALDEGSEQEVILELRMFVVRRRPGAKGFATKLAQAGRKRADDFAVRKRVGEYEQLISTITSSP